MFTSMRIITAILVGVLLTFMTSGAAMAQATKGQRSVPDMTLTISKDGSAIVNQDGEVIARFAPGTNVQSIAPGVAQKLPGCMRCTDECIIYEGEVCVKYVRSCTWDFDCKK